ATQAIFKNKATTGIEKTKKILLGTTGKTPQEMEATKKAWNQLRFAWLEDTIAKSSEEGVPLGSKFGKALNDMGDDALKIMFNDLELKNIKDMALLGKLIQQKPENQLAGILIKVLQAGAVGGGAASGKTKSALLILGGPAVLARYMTSDIGRKYLTEGFKYGGEQTGQIIKGLLKTKIEMELEREKLKKFEIDEQINRRKREYKNLNPQQQLEADRKFIFGGPDPMGKYK
ncbi:MAG: hypothetical protein IMZ53_10160, partial [Thermoplasmata archaeon]|nr:hypothetical protein [Thermoplasmata archaeon]